MALEEVDLFFDKQDFAVEAIYTAESGVARKILVIFSDEFTPSLVGDTTYQNVAPTALVKAADAPDITIDETLKISTVTYKIIKVQTDSTGLKQLTLSKD